MNAGNNNNFAAPHVGLVNFLGEIIAPIANGIASIIIAGIDFVALRRHNRGLVVKQSGNQSGPAPHVALMMVPAEFVTAPFKKY